MNDSMSSTSDDSERVLTSLLRMEAESLPDYNCPDYLRQRREKSDNNDHQVHLNEVWRSKVCEWFYRVIDRHPNDLSRDVVFFAMNILDRFLAKTGVDRFLKRDCAKSFYQLAAMTSIYIGAKVYCQKNRLNKNGERANLLESGDEAISIEDLVGMSTAGFCVEDIGEMEKCVLTTLSWNICPIAPSLIVRTMLHALNTKNPNPFLDELYQDCRFLCELAVCDYYFVGSKSSAIALASILVTIERKSSSDKGAYNSLSSTIKSLSQSSGWPLIERKDVLDVRDRLMQLLETQSEIQNNRKETVLKDNEDGQEEEEPRRVKRQKLVRVVSSEDLTKQC
jgi:hypothetical protein